MASGNVRKRASAHGDSLSGRVAKRANLSGSCSGLEEETAEVEGEAGNPKLNRLQRAIAKSSKSSRTAVVSRRIQSKKNTGALSALLESPIEIFYEVCLNLTPMDLLALARVSQPLRDIIMSKSSQRIWATSFSSTDLPPCPEDLNEPQYASLVYDTECNACGVPHVKSVYYALRIRLCNGCFKLNLVSDAIIIEEVSQVLSEKINMSMTSEEVKLLAQLLIKCVPAHKTWNKSKYYRPDVHEVLTGLLSTFLESKERVKAFETFITDGLDLRGRIENHAKLLQTWADAKAKERETQLDSISHKNARSVKSRLRELDYNREDWTYKVDVDHDADRKEWKKLVYQKREITDRIWKSLLPKLKDFLNKRRLKIRHTKRRGEFKAHYEDYYYSLPLTFGEIDLMPETSLVLENELVKSTLYWDDPHRVLDDTVWESLLPTVEAACKEEIAKAVIAHERALMGYKAATPSEAKGRLGRIKANNERNGHISKKIPQEAKHVFLASSFFQDRRKDWMLERVYFFTSPWSIDVGCRAYDTHPYELDTYRRKPKRMWSTDYYYVSNIDVPEALLKDLELKKDTKMCKMLNMGKCFVCLRCPEVLRRNMSWGDIVQHYLDEVSMDDFVMCAAHLRRYGIKYKSDHALARGKLVHVLSADEITSYEALAQANLNPPELFRCKLCKQVIGHSGGHAKMNREQIETHVRVKHKKEPSEADFQDINDEDLMIVVGSDTDDTSNTDDSDDSDDDSGSLGEADDASASESSEEE